MNTSSISGSYKAAKNIHKANSMKKKMEDAVSGASDKISKPKSDSVKSD